MPQLKKHFSILTPRECGVYATEDVIIPGEHFPECIPGAGSSMYQKALPHNPLPTTAEKISFGKLHSCSEVPLRSIIHMTKVWVVL